MKRLTFYSKKVYSVSNELIHWKIKNSTIIGNAPTSVIHKALRSTLI